MAAAAAATLAAPLKKLLRSTFTALAPVVFDWPSTAGSSRFLDILFSSEIRDAAFRPFGPRSWV